jgi:nitrite reductase (NO-forming)
VLSSLLLALLQPLELSNVQSTLVPAGGATMVEFKTEIPGTYILVDHSLSRLQKGAAGYLDVEGPPNPRVFQSILAGSQDGGSASQLQSS